MKSVLPNKNKHYPVAFQELHAGMIRVHMNEPNLQVPPELGHLSTFIDSHIECLAGSSSELRSVALCAAKHIFDWGEIDLFGHFSKA